MKNQYKFALFIISLFIFVSMIDLSSAWYADTFNNSLTSEVLLFPTPGSYIRYLAVPQGTIVNLGRFNLTYPSGLTIANPALFPIARYLRLDESSGTVKDEIAGSNGTVVNTVSRGKPGIIGASYNFSGAGYVNFTSPSTVCEDLNCSVNLWINYSSTSNQYFYYNGNISKGGGGAIEIYNAMSTSQESAGDVCLTFENRTDTDEKRLCSGFPLNNNKWNMITAVFNRTSLLLYVNGTLIKQHALNSTNQNIELVNRREYLGARAVGSGDVGDFAKIATDEVYLSNFSLTSADVSTLYNNGAGYNFTTFVATEVGNITFTLGGLEVQNFSIANGTVANASTLITGLQTRINNYLATCSFIASICNVPFNFTSNVYDSFIKYDLLNFSDQSFTENSQNFSMNTTSGSTESFTINITYNTGYYTSITPTLVYNNTAYSPTQATIGPDTIFNATIVVPITNVQVVKPFYWSFILTNSSGSVSYINSTAHSQTISPFSIDSCGVNTQQILNFTLFDEDTRQNINGTIEVTTNIYTFGTTSLIASSNQSHAYTIGSPARVCIATLASGSRYSGSYETKYYGNQTVGTGLYAVEYKFAQNFTIDSTSTAQDIALYDLLDSRSTEFTITVQSTDLSVIQGAVIDVQRQYIPINQFISVEGPLTDTSGNAIAHLVTSQVYYNFIVTKQGQLLGTFNNYQVQCQNQVTGDCRINLNLIQATGNLPDFTNYGNVSINVSLNRPARTLYLNFISTDGNSHLVAWNVSTLSNYGNNTICTNSQSGTSGSFSCIIPVTYGNTSLLADLYSDGIYIGRSIFSLQPDSEDIFGGTRIIIGMVMYSMLGLLMIGSPPLIIIGSIMGMGFVIAFHLIDGGSFLGNTSIFLWFVIAGAIILYYMRNKT